MLSLQLSCWSVNKGLKGGGEGKENVLQSFHNLFVLFSKVVKQCMPYLLPLVALLKESNQ